MACNCLEGYQGFLHSAGQPGTTTDSDSSTTVTFLASASMLMLTPASPPIDRGPTWPRGKEVVFSDAEGFEPRTSSIRKECSTTPPTTPGMASASVFTSYFHHWDEEISSCWHFLFLSELRN